MAVFPGSGREDNTSKVVETAASVVAVLMLTSGVSVVDSHEYTLRSTFVEGSAMWFKVAVALSFFLLNTTKILRMLGHSSLEITFSHFTQKLGDDK